MGVSLSSGGEAFGGEDRCGVADRAVDGIRIDLGEGAFAEHRGPEWQLGVAPLRNGWIQAHRA